MLYKYYRTNHSFLVIYCLLLLFLYIVYTIICKLFYLKKETLQPYQIYWIDVIILKVLIATKINYNLVNTFGKYWKIPHASIIRVSQYLGKNY